MASKEVLYTKEGYEEAVERLEYLKSTKRHEIAAKIKAAREFGDLSENAEYEEAKQEQGFVEGEIVELEYKIKNAKIIDESTIPSGVIHIGSTVKFWDADMEEEYTYTIVGSDEADLDEGRISNESPVGIALIGAKAGETVSVKAPFGSYDVKIIEIL